MAGAVQVTVAELHCPAVAVPMVGAPAVVAGVTALDWRRLAAGADAVDGRHREGVRVRLVSPVTVSVVAVELKVWVAWATPAL